MRWGFACHGGADECGGVSHATGGADECGGVSLATGGADECGGVSLATGGADECDGVSLATGGGVVCCPVRAIDDGAGSRPGPLDPRASGRSHAAARCLPSLLPPDGPHGTRSRREPCSRRIPASRPVGSRAVSVLDAGTRSTSKSTANAECRMPNAKCRMPNAKCRMPNAKCQMLNAKCQ